MCAIDPKKFQLTLPVWGATPCRFATTSSLNISTHAPRVGSDEWYIAHTLVLDISTHAPRVGSDQAYNPQITPGGISTHAPRVGSDRHEAMKPHRSGISTHAPRVGSDRRRQPHNPPTERFQLTLPVWGATMTAASANTANAFQLTLPVWGATTASPRLSRRLLHVNSRSPCGERPVRAKRANANHKISTHAPRVGSDRR